MSHSSQGFVSYLRHVVRAFISAPMFHIRFAVVQVVILVAFGCATKRDFVVREVPGWNIVTNIVLDAPKQLSARDQKNFTMAWINLQEGELATAVNTLDALSRQYGHLPELIVARGYVELRSGNVTLAEEYFEQSVEGMANYTPGLGGHFLVAIASSNEDIALKRLSRLRDADPNYPLVRSYGDRWQMEVAESRLGKARRFVKNGTFDTASDAYVEAIIAAPESSWLYIEAAEIDLLGGTIDRALGHSQAAIALEPKNGSAHRVLAESFYKAGDVERAYESYNVASRLRPRDEEIEERLKEIGFELDSSKLPAEYFEIAEASQIRRGQLAALLYLEFRMVFDAMQATSNSIATDINGNWAAQYIRKLLQLGVLEVFPNHTFQPETFVSRIDLARSFGAVLKLLNPSVYVTAKRAAGYEHLFTDVSTENIYYEPAAVCASLGILQVGDSGEFGFQGKVSGPDLVLAVAALASNVRR